MFDRIAFDSEIMARVANVIARLQAAPADCNEPLTSGAVVMVEETRMRVRNFPIL